MKWGGALPSVSLLRASEKPFHIVVKALYLTLRKTVRFMLKLVALALLSACFYTGCGDESEEKEKTTSSVTDRRGHQLYMTNGCAVCHGDLGHGDGRIANTLRPAPRDFRDLSHYKRGSSVEQIAETIARGIGGTSMPGYPHLTSQDRLSIAQHIVFLQNQP